MDNEQYIEVDSLSLWIISSVRIANSYIRGTLEVAAENVENGGCSTFVRRPQSQGFMKNPTFGAFSEGGICNVLPELMVAGSNLRQDTFDLFETQLPR